MKPGWEKRFDKMWFAPRHETTLMNWDGLIAGDEGILDNLFGLYRSRSENEAYLKETLAELIKDFIERESL